MVEITRLTSVMNSSDIPIRYTTVHILLNLRFPLGYGHDFLTITTIQLVHPQYTYHAMLAPNPPNFPTGPAYVYILLHTPFSRPLYI